MQENKIQEKSNIIEKIYFGKYKILISFLVIFLINLFFFISFDLKAMLFVDTSRELYIPMAMNDGAVLYKDIFNVYAPLGYQINALLTSVFGERIQTFFNIGFVNSTLILWGLFLILRFVVKGSSLYKLGIIFFIMSACVYSVSHTNYVFPYSYSMVFALNAFIWSLVSLLYFVKKDKIKFLYFSYLLFGLSISCKYEFLPFILILLGISAYKKVKIKNVLFSLFFMSIVPFLSLSDLLIKGVNYVDIKQSILYILLLSKAKSVSALYSYLGFIPSLDSLKFVGMNFVRVLGFSLACVCYYVLLFYFIPILREKFSKLMPICYLLSIILALIPFYFIFKFLVPVLTESNAFYFSWIGIFTLLLFVFRWKKILNSNFYLFILFITAILCSGKCLFNVSFNSYGTYFFPLLFICCFLYMSEVAIEQKETDKKYTRIIFMLLIYSLFLLFSLSNEDRLKFVFEDEKLPFIRGNVHTEKQYYSSVKNALLYLTLNTNKDDTVLVLPEGAMINFITERKSHNKFYYLIPPNIEVFGEDYIVEELEKDLPEYLVIQPMSFNNFNETYFCESFGKKICGLIPTYYEQPKVFGEDFWIAIYKRKNIENVK